MREIEHTTQFERDYKREAKGQHRRSLDASLVAVLAPLVNNEVLAERFRDHALSGEWLGYRDFHVKPDLVLIYEKPDDDTLRQSGAMHPDSKAQTVRSLDRTNLRLSAETFGEIDVECAARPGNVSRNTWITEAVHEKLAREQTTGALQGSERRAHG